MLHKLLGIIHDFSVDGFRLGCLSEIKICLNAHTQLGLVRPLKFACLWRDGYFLNSEHFILHEWFGVKC